MSERAPTRWAIRKCAEFLYACRGFGWAASDLDALEALWWRYHNDRGELTR